MAVDPASIRVLDVVETDLRSVFAGEARVFTPWLARDENLSRLAGALGMRLEVVGTEESTGSFRVDLIARSVEDDSLVIVENQFGASDHDHLGKALTYLAATADREARSVVWLAELFRDEHKAVLTWLNDNTPEDVGFYGVVPKLLKIGDGPPGLRFEIAVAPNRVVKQARAVERSFDPSVGEMRERYWPIFERHLRADPGLAGVVTKFGGRLGYMHLFPDARFARIDPAVFCLAFLQVPATMRYRTGVWTRPNPGRAGELAERVERIQARVNLSEAEGGLGADQVEFDPDSDLETVAIEHVARCKRVIRALADMFEPEAAAVPAA